MFERFTTSARAVVRSALAQTNQSIDVEHLFLGVVHHADGPLRDLLAEVGITADDAKDELRSGEGPLGDVDAEALRSIGIDLDAVRRSLESTFGEGALDREPPRSRSWFGKPRSRVTNDGRKTLELSLREAIRLKSREIGVEHLLLGILRAPNVKVTKMIEAHVPISVLRGRVEALTSRAA